MNNCFVFVNKFKRITWTKTTFTICFIPFMLSLLIFIIIILCSVDRMGSVVCNSRSCAKVGNDILRKSGSAVDAAIGTLLCEGVALPNAMGIGGGFTAIMRVSGRFDSIIATPTLPSSFNVSGLNDTNFRNGVKSIGVPGELKGYWEMHRRYGLLPWKEIVQPSIDFCRDGIPMTAWFAGVMRDNYIRILRSPTLKKLFSSNRNITFQQDAVMKYPLLAKTLRKIADHGADAFYGGDVGKDFIKDIQKYGGILTLDDLINYEVLWNENLPRTRLLGKYTIITSPPPSSGVAVVFILNIMKFLRRQENMANFWHYAIEAAKYGLSYYFKLSHPLEMDSYKKMISPDIARKYRDKIDPDEALQFEKLSFDVDSKLGLGAVSICVTAPNGDLVVATSFLMHDFGSHFGSKKTGIIGNRLLRSFIRNDGTIPEDFQSPIAPNLHAVSPHCPSVVLDELDRPYFLVGTAAGQTGITLLANSIIRYVILKEMTRDAMRTSDQFLYNPVTDSVEYHGNPNEKEVAYLKKIGHKVIELDTNYINFPTLVAIGHRHLVPSPEYNYKRGGSSAIIPAKQTMKPVVFTMLVSLCITVLGIMLYEVLHPGRPEEVSATFI